MHSQLVLYISLLICKMLGSTLFDMLGNEVRDKSSIYSSLFDIMLLLFCFWMILILLGSFGHPPLLTYGPHQCDYHDFRPSPSVNVFFKKNSPSIIVCVCRHASITPGCIQTTPKSPITWRARPFLDIPHVRQIN